MLLKERLQAGDVCYGPFLKLAEPGVVEIVASAGFDHVIIDLEHGPLSVETAQNLVRAAELHGIAPLIRVGANEPARILRALDVGAQGVHIPHISTAADARRAVDACFFHPAGSRGVCRYVRAAAYTQRTAAEHFAAANRRTLPVLHIEGREGVTNLRDILAVPGIGVVFLGPYDLSQSCGVPGEVHHPQVLEAMQEALALAQAAGAVLGTFVDNAADAHRWRERGVRYICYSVDVGIFMDACRTAVAALHDSG